ncbi:putative MFS family arabinose efflux permease [Saccharothrix saharensis]|uniref:Putative MFS family arabinose efflux permease n=1 Tax=Saccharothrix saharensis TaxID=571190 RepID=A0A543JK82_9PSEU|nr:MFS transporter [Saccharothrix saharensis]TQM83181.1 putative MFS family arabinose efflux permease [Saccharothrix saharensis]
MTTTTGTPAKSSLWTPERRGPTVGIILLVTLLAFENMGVSTAMPRMVADLDGNDLYAWPFLAFLAASVVATVLSGRLSDLRGPRPSLLVGPALFLVGLIVAGVAQDMSLLLLGRVLQGIGGGAQVVAVYVLIGLVYPERDRPAVFGLLASAWVVPSLVGPALAGWLTEALSWRWVFLGLAPFVLLGVLLLVPVLRNLPPHTPDRNTRRGLPMAALGAGFGVAALSWAAQHPRGVNLLIGVAGLVALVPSLRVLLPRGTLTARPGLPTTILARALLAGSFFAAEAFIPLTLTSVHGYSAIAAGIPLTLSALGWSAAAWWQSRKPDIPRAKLVRWGFVLNAAGISGVTLIAPSWGPAWATPVLWAVAGAGMGMAMSSLSVLTLGASSEVDRGFNSSALQISDMLGSALLVGLGGVLVTTFASAAAPTAAVVPFDLLMAGVAVLGAVLAGRLGRATLES